MNARFCWLAWLPALLLITPQAPAAANPATDYANAIVAASNVIRAQNQLPPLNPDVRLAAAALAHAQAMADAQILDHQVPGEADPGTRFRDAGYDWNKWGENLAAVPYPDESVDDLMQEWMADPTHRVNLLDPDFQDIGVGVWAVAAGPNQFAFWVAQDFGQKALQPKIQVTPTQLTFSAMVGRQQILSFAVTNVGDPGSTLTGTIAPAPADFIVTDLFDDFSLPKGSSKQIQVIFKPRAAGRINGTAAVASNDPNNPRVVVQLVGLANNGPQPRIDATPGSMDFGNVAAGPSKGQILNVLNVGDIGSTLTGTVTVTTTGPQGADATFGLNLATTTTTDTFSLRRLANKQWKVFFNPRTTFGPVTGLITITSNDAATPTVTIALSANVPKPKLVVVTSALDFGIVVKHHTSDGTLTIKNDGEPGSLLAGTISVPQFFSFVGHGTLGNGATISFSSIRAGASDSFKIRVVNPLQDPQAGQRTEKATITSNGGNGSTSLKVDFRLRAP